MQTTVVMRSGKKLSWEEYRAQEIRKIRILKDLQTPAALANASKRIRQLKAWERLRANSRRAYETR